MDCNYCGKEVDDIGVVIASGLDHIQDVWKVHEVYHIPCFYEKVALSTLKRVLENLYGADRREGIQEST